MKAGASSDLISFRRRIVGVTFIQSWSPYVPLYASFVVHHLFLSLVRTVYLLALFWGYLKLKILQLSVSFEQARRWKITVTHIEPPQLIIGSIDCDMADHILFRSAPSSTDLLV